MFNKISCKFYLQLLYSLLLSYIFKLKTTNVNYLNIPYGKGSVS